MKNKNEITKAIFGFKDEEIGIRLSNFYEKHTGKYVDFNKIEHYKNGLKLLLFSIPLDTIEQIGITAAGCSPSYVKRFSKLDDFIDWYENDYLEHTDEENFRKECEKLNLKLDVAFDPFPKFAQVEVVNLFPKKGEASATIILLNNLLCRVPLKEAHKCALILNINIFINTRKYSWDRLFRHLGIEATQDENITRFTPDDKYVFYDKKYDSDVVFLFNYYNCFLNITKPFEYPKNWFEVVKELIPLHGGPVGCDGKYIAAYMLAAPRKYLRYFKSKMTSKEIALEIFYDNL